MSGETTLRMILNRQPLQTHQTGKKKQLQFFANENLPISLFNDYCFATHGSYCPNKNDKSFKK